MAKTGVSGEVADVAIQKLDAGESITKVDQMISQAKGGIKPLVTAPTIPELAPTKPVAGRKAEIAPTPKPEAVGVEIPKELKLLAEEAKKYKSVEEWRKFDEDKEISKVLTAVGKYSEKNELLRKWGGDKSDVDIITDFYNQVAQPPTVAKPEQVKPKGKPGFVDVRSLLKVHKTFMNIVEPSKAVELKLGKEPYATVI